MAAKKPTRPDAKEQLVTGTLVNQDPVAQSRLLSDLASAQRAAPRVERSSTTIDLKVGANVINHGLGGKPRGATISPTVADVTYAAAMTAADDRQATISVLNIAQPGAGVEFWR
jgi:hypothetical protein